MNKLTGPSRYERQVWAEYWHWPFNHGDRIHVHPGPRGAVAVHLVCRAGSGGSRPESYVVNFGTLRRSVQHARQLAHVLLHEYDHKGGDGVNRASATITPLAAADALVAICRGSLSLHGWREEEDHHMARVEALVELARQRGMLAGVH